MTRNRILALLIVAGSLVYLAAFVNRGWVPHDEGMLGQSAERVMLGQLPHVDYEEPYSGGLSVLHAATFEMFGIDLLHLRWMLFVAVAAAQFLVYAILRRFLAPIAAAFVSTLSLIWSFPNYFASLPSWWILLCAVACVWAFVRYTETESIWYAGLAGLAAGTSILFKQTGLYVLVALVLALLYGRSPRAIRTVAAIVSTGLAIAVLRSRLAVAESLYLLLPVVACGVLLISAEERKTDDLLSSVRLVAWTVAFAALPLVAGIIPYATSGHVGTLLNGLFVLPQRRLQFASLAMSHAQFIFAGVPCVALVSPWANRVPVAASHRRLATVGLSLIAAVIVAVSFKRYAAYQLIWQSGRAFAALLPVIVSWYLFGRNEDDVKQRRVLFAATAMLAWASLVQFPFSGAIYFCYTVPLVAIAAAASARYCSTSKHPALAVWCAALMVFGVFSMNRGYLDNLGAWHQHIAMDQKLDLPRAHFDVKPEEVATYRRVNTLVTEHVGKGELLAGPDAPEVYFLAGRLNPSGVLFDFFSGGIAGEDDTAWTDTRVVVLNHRPGFSPPPSEQLSASVRSLFPNGESVGRFEVRWR